MMADGLSRYINRELSWLEFNQRVLDEARDASIPLLERLKFLAITGSNLDEFFMVRVGGLQMLAQQRSTKTDPAGMTPGEQLKAISGRVHRMVLDQYICFCKELEPALASAGVQRRQPGNLSKFQRSFLEQLIDGEVRSVLTPVAVTSAADFPRLINKSLNMCVQLQPAPDASNVPRFAVVGFGRASHRFITLPSAGGYEYMPLEDALSMFIDRFFPGEIVEACVPFRLTRNADYSVREDMAGDLLSQMQEVIDARKDSACVRLELSSDVPKTVHAFLQQAASVGDEDTYAAPGPLDLSAMMQLTGLHGFDQLRYEEWAPRRSPAVDAKASMFDVLSQRDVLLYHPFESYEPVVRLLEEAADDPEVLAIKQTLYRSSKHSPIVAALKRAAEQGKYVTAIVELKARFDEARNIEWAKEMERSDVQVIYGVKGLKTHAKICIIVRREPHGIQRYVHFGTGNYNEVTARLYIDVSYMTRNDELGADAVTFFNTITGYSQPQRFRKIAAAPISLREKLLEMIESETRRCRHGQQAHIMAKLNALADSAIIDALYEASQAGVTIRLNVRGICCLRPGVPGLSDNITVVSIVDRFLEHSRILYFHHGGDESVFISSADWMPRNLDRRVELLTPVEDTACQVRLIKILESCFTDTAKARRLRADGRYEPIAPPPGSAGHHSQRHLFEEATAAIKEAERSRRTVFEPHRASDGK